MAQPRKPKTTPASKSGLEDGDGAPPPQGNPKHGGPKRPVEEEDIYGGAERTHSEHVRSQKAKP